MRPSLFNSFEIATLDGFFEIVWGVGYLDISWIMIGFV